MTDARCNACQCSSCQIAENHDSQLHASMAAVYSFLGRTTLACVAAGAAAGGPGGGGQGAAGPPGGAGGAAVPGALPDSQCILCCCAEMQDAQLPQCANERLRPQRALCCTAASAVQSCGSMCNVHLEPNFKAYRDQSAHVRTALPLASCAAEAAVYCRGPVDPQNSIWIMF